MGALPVEDSEKKDPAVPRTALIILGICLAVILSPVMRWWTESTFGDMNNLAHWLVPFITGAFLWHRRERFGAPGAIRLPAGPLLMLAFSFLLILAGYSLEIIMLSAFAVIPLLLGLIRIFWPPEKAKHFNFPVLFLVFALPWAEVLNKELGFPLRILAARFAHAGFGILGIDAVREGTLVYTEKFQMELIPACSGLSYMFMLLYTGVLIAGLTQKAKLTKLITILLIFPVSVFANGLRVFLIGLIGHFLGAEAAESVFHDYGGLLLFAIALALLFAIISAMQKLDRKLVAHGR